MTLRVHAAGFIPVSRRFHSHGIRVLGDRSAWEMLWPLRLLMPCDGAWPPEHVAVFQHWIAGGSAP